MKRLVFLMLILFFSANIWLLSNKKGKKRVFNLQKQSITATATPIRKKRVLDKEKSSVVNVEEKECVIAVYWVSLDGIGNSKYDKLLYFGIAPTLTGDFAKDKGYLKLKDFKSAAFNKSKELVVRMTDKEFNSKFLKSEIKVKEGFIKNLEKLLVEYGFEGVVFDIELSPFQTELEQPLVEFLEMARKELKDNFKLGLLAYADSFYRKRPYDFSALEKNIDEVYLMAYDFTKSISEPGPNFPLYKGSKWGYSLVDAVDDFAKVFNKEKITIVFGMYGYDWQMSYDKKPLGRAKALSLNQIRKKYLELCTPENCVITFNPIASEKEMNIVFSKFEDNKATVYPRVVWFEDNETVEKKKEVLKNKGISNFCYFAWGYY